MALSDVIEDNELTMKEIHKRLRARANGPSPELIDSLSKYVNTYRKLFELRKKFDLGGLDDDWDYEQDGDPTWADRLVGHDEDE